MPDPRALLAALHPAHTWRAIAALMAEHGYTMSAAGWQRAATGKIALRWEAACAVCSACGVEPPEPDAQTVIRQTHVQRAVVMAEEPDTAIMARLGEDVLTGAHLYVQNAPGAGLSAPPQCVVTVGYMPVAKRRPRKPLSIPRLPLRPLPPPKTRHGKTVNFETLGAVLAEAAGNMRGEIVTNDTSLGAGSCAIIRVS